jgi:2-amino-4-hydroxy-6-hydroxymethyldihydropteridine diphosphokinase
MAELTPTFSNLAVIALGGNIGDSMTILDEAIAQIEATQGIKLIKYSSWYQTKPVGGPPQADYINGCAIVETSLPPEQLLPMMLAIEQDFGRVRIERWGARTLDLDLIFYHDQIINDEPTLIVPHPRMQERAFVLVPLAEIAPNWIDPRSGQSVQALLDQLKAIDGEQVATVQPINTR